jgi:hypothetical protein
MNQYPLFAYIVLFSPILPICIGISKKTNIRHAMNLLFYYILFSFAADIYFGWFVSVPLHLGLVHAYYLVEYIFIISIVLVWQESPRVKQLFQALMLIYMIFWIIAKLTFEPLNGLYSVTASVSQVILALSAGYTLFVVTENRTQSLMNNYRFWVLLSFVIFYAGTLLTIALRGILIQYSREIFFLVATIDWSLKIVFNILLAIGFLCPQTQT